MKTYWLNGRKDIPESDMPQCPFLAIMQEEVRSRQAEEVADLARVPQDMGSQAGLHSYSPVSFKDMRMDAASPLGNAGASAGGFFALDAIGSSSTNLQQQHPHLQDSSNTNSLGITTTTQRKVSLPKCPFSSGMMTGMSDRASLAGSSENNGQGVPLSLSGPHINGSTPVATSVTPPSNTDIRSLANQNTARPGLTSPLDSGIAMTTGPSSETLQDEREQPPVPRVNVVRPNQASPSSRNEYSPPSATIQNSQGNASVYIKESKDQTTVVASQRPSQTSTISSQPISKLRSNGDNVFPAEEMGGKGFQGMPAHSPAGNGNVAAGNWNSLSPDAQTSKNGTHALVKDHVFVSDSNTKIGSKKSRMCHVL